MSGVEFRAPQKRSLSLSRQRTSISLEPVFWGLLTEHAKSVGRSINSVVTEIDAARGDVNLSCALRTFLLHAAISKATQSAQVSL